MKLSEARHLIERGELNEKLEFIYGKANAASARERYLNLLSTFEKDFPGREDIFIISTPGRTEVGGNHTDHNAGRVLAASVNLDCIAVVSSREDNTVNVHSEGYPNISLSTDDLSVKEHEQFTSIALIRGVLARCRDLGYTIGGFDACVTSNVLMGSGLSSSAAFEVLMVSIISHLYNDGKIDDIENAKIAQFAENIYFGKPCGLMDQTACAVGNLVFIDFRDFDNPIVEKVDFRFSDCRYEMVIVDTGGSHADLNDDYVDLEHEMKQCARALGGEVLRDVSMEKLMTKLPEIRGTISDRAILRAVHFFYDDVRVVKQVECLKKNDFKSFLKEITDSGYNSFTYCQNCYSSKHPHEQGISVALAVTENILAGNGAYRVHGGGFAGTIQAFVPDELIESYAGEMRRLFGEHSVYRILIRPVGTTRVL